LEGLTGLACLGSNFVLGPMSVPPAVAGGSTIQSGAVGRLTHPLPQVVLTTVQPKT
jgi:hypothetical protein